MEILASDSPNVKRKTQVTGMKGTMNWIMVKKTVVKVGIESDYSFKAKMRTQALVEWGT